MSHNKHKPGRELKTPLKELTKRIREEHKAKTDEDRFVQLEHLEDIDCTMASKTPKGRVLARSNGSHNFASLLAEEQKEMDVRPPSRKGGKSLG